MIENRIDLNEAAVSPETELLEAAEAALELIRGCDPMTDGERWDLQAGVVVRLRTAIRIARKARPIGSTAETL